MVRNLKSHLVFSKKSGEGFPETNHLNFNEVKLTIYYLENYFSPLYEKAGVAGNHTNDDDSISIR